MVPTKPTLSKILHHHFKLAYGRLLHANLKYRDPTYDEKRLWISRLMAQFLHDNLVIVCIDESNFRSECIPNKQWQFQGIRQVMRSRSRSKKLASEAKNNG